MTPKVRAAFGLTALVAFVAACNAVLGYDAATLDPTIDAGAPGNDAGTGTTGGNACDRYCTSIMAHCTGPNQEYTTVDVCKAMCSHFEPGLPGDTSQDSLACRTYHAAAAENDPNFHCRHAGPLGGGVCGDEPCHPYCLLDFALCGGQPVPPFDGGENGCRAECTGHFRYDTGPDAGDITQTSGDTLNCRLYHLESAYDPSNPNAAPTHCPHTATVSATCQ